MVVDLALAEQSINRCINQQFIPGTVFMKGELSSGDLWGLVKQAVNMFISFINSPLGPIGFVFVISVPAL